MRPHRLPRIPRGGLSPGKQQLSAPDNSRPLIIAATFGGEIPRECVADRREPFGHTENSLSLSFYLFIPLTGMLKKFIVEMPEFTVAHYFAQKLAGPRSVDIESLKPPLLPSLLPSSIVLPPYGNANIPRNVKNVQNVLAWRMIEQGERGRHLCRIAIVSRDFSRRERWQRRRGGRGEEQGDNITAVKTSTMMPSICT